MRIMIQTERYKCSPSHPMKTKIQGMTKNRIKRESFIHKTTKFYFRFTMCLDLRKQ